MIRNLKAGTLVHMQGMPVTLTENVEAESHNWSTIDALAQAAVEGSDDEAAFEIPGIEQTVAEAASELLRSERKGE